MKPRNHSVTLLLCLFVTSLIAGCSTSANESFHSRIIGTWKQVSPTKANWIGSKNEHVKSVANMLSAADTSEYPVLRYTHPEHISWKLLVQNTSKDSSSQVFLVFSDSTMNINEHPYINLKVSISDENYDNDGLQSNVSTGITSSRIKFHDDIICDTTYQIHNMATTLAFTNQQTKDTLKVLKFDLKGMTTTAQLMKCQ